MHKIQCLLRFAGVFALLGIAIQVAQGQGLQDTWKFSISPQSGNISGQAGSTIGWGYNLENDSSMYWLLAFDVRSDTPFQYGTASSNPFDYPVLAPGTTVSTPYDGNVGLADLTWDVDAPINYVNSGSFIITSGWYDGDPFNGGNLVGDAGTKTAFYSATVVSTTPEPSSLVTLLIGSSLLVFNLVTRQGNRRK